MGLNGGLQGQGLAIVGNAAALVDHDVAGGVLEAVDGQHAVLGLEGLGPLEGQGQGQAVAHGPYEGAGGVFSGPLGSEGGTARNALQQALREADLLVGDRAVLDQLLDHFADDALFAGDRVDVDVGSVDVPEGGQALVGQRGLRLGLTGEVLAFRANLLLEQGIIGVRQAHFVGAGLARDDVGVAGGVVEDRLIQAGSAANMAAAAVIMAAVLATRAVHVGADAFPASRTEAEIHGSSGANILHGDKAIIGGVDNAGAVDVSAGHSHLQINRPTHHRPIGPPVQGVNGVPANYFCLPYRPIRPIKGGSIGGVLLPKVEIDDEFQGDTPPVIAGGYELQVRSGPTAWVNGPLVRVPLVGLLGLLHVPWGAQMSRNYGIRPDHRQVYIPPEEKFPRVFGLISMLVGGVLLGALLTGMMFLAQLLYWLMP